MLNFLKKLFGTYEAKPAATVESAPYKVPEPPAMTPIPLVVEEAAPAPVEKPAKAKKAPAKPKAPAAAKPKAPAKPRAPKAPKATQ